MIRAFLKGQQKDWDLNLGCLAGAYRATPQDSTTLSPNLMMLGREVKLPHEVIFGSSIENEKYTKVSNYGVYVCDLKNTLQKAHEVARKHLNKSAERQQIRYDAKVFLNNFKEGDIVWMLNESREVGICEKLQAAFLGPYLVTEVCGRVNFKVQLNPAGKTKVVHHDKLKRYTGVNPPKWITTQMNKIKRHERKQN